MMLKVNAREKAAKQNYAFSASLTSPYRSLTSVTEKPYREKPSDLMTFSVCMYVNTSKIVKRPLPIRFFATARTLRFTAANYY